MASTSIRRTNSGNGNRKKWTFSAWIKRTGLGSVQRLLSCDEAGNNNHDDFYQFQNDDTLVLGHYDSGYYANLTPNRKFRDTNAWYHFVITWDTAQSTAANRFKFYVNGVQETSFSTSTYPSQNADSFINTTEPMEIGKRSDNDTQYLDALLTHVHFCDGYAYQASDFGETDSTTGIWKAKTAPSVNYGTNGFFILKNGNSLIDQSSNSNNWTSVSGTLTDMKDCPDNVFATLDVLNQEAQSNGTTFLNGNNTYSSGGHSNVRFFTTNLGANSGKYYCEIKPTSLSSHNLIGISSHGITSAMSDFYFAGSGNVAHTGDEFEYGYKAEDGNQVNNATASSYGNTYTTNDIIGIAMDLDNNKLYFSKNGVFQNSGDPTSGSTGTGAISITAPASTDTGFYFFAVAKATSSTNTATFQCNFGNGYFGTTAVSSAGTNASGIGIFEYDVPNGYTALSTKGLNE